MTARSQAGFTIVEVAVGLLIALAAVAATMVVINSGYNNSLGHQRQADLSAIARKEIEATRAIVRRYGFEALALSGTTGQPGSSLPENPSNPDDFVQAWSSADPKLRIPVDYHATSKGLLATEDLVIGTVSIPGRVTPVSTGVSNGKLTATVYRYVSQRTEPTCTVSSCELDSRRVTIAVVPSRTVAQDQRGPVYLSTVINNSIPSDVSTGGGGIAIGVNIP